MSTGMVSECALVCSSMARSADGREVRDHVPPVPDPGAEPAVEQQPGS